MTTSPKR